MWRRKKLLLVAVATVVVLAGVISGVVLAAGNGDENQAGASSGAVWDKVCTIYEQNTGVALDSAALQDAFAQAQSELRTEAMQSRLQSLVDEGKITQEQANDIQNWLEAKPDVPFGLGFGGHEGFRGMGGGHGFGGLCPQPSD